MPKRKKVVRQTQKGHVSETVSKEEIKRENLAADHINTPAFDSIPSRDELLDL